MRQITKTEVVKTNDLENTFLTLEQNDVVQLHIKKQIRNSEQFYTMPFEVDEIQKDTTQNTDVITGIDTHANQKIQLKLPWNPKDTHAGIPKPTPDGPPFVVINTEPAVLLGIVSL